MKKSKKGTLSVEILHENYVKTRVVIVDNSQDIAQHFYNQRLLNQFKRTLKKRGIEYKFYRDGGFTGKEGVLIVERFGLVLIALGDGRFHAYKKNCHLGLKFTFEASSQLEILVKLMKFNIIGIGAVKQIGDI